MGEIQASKVTRRWEVGEMSAGSLEEMTKTESYGGNGDKELCKKDWGGAEDTGKFMASVILCSLKYSKEGGLTYVSEPNLGSVRKDRNENRMKDAAPWDKLQALDRIPEDAKSLN